MAIPNGTDSRREGLEILVYNRVGDDKMRGVARDRLRRKEPDGANQSQDRRKKDDQALHDLLFIAVGGQENDMSCANSVKAIGAVKSNGLSSPDLARQR